MCARVAKFHSYQQRPLLTLHGPVTLQRAYYYCRRCHQSYCPYDTVLGLEDEISPGLRPLVCLAGTLPTGSARCARCKREGSRCSAVIP